MNDSASCKDTTTCPHKEEKKEFVKDYHQHWEGYEQHTLPYESITPEIEKRLKQDLRWLFRTFSYVTWEKV